MELSPPAYFEGRGGTRILGVRPVIHTDGNRFRDFRIHFKAQNTDDLTAYVVVRRPPGDNSSDLLSGYAIAIGGSSSAPLGSVTKFFRSAVEAIPEFDRSASATFIKRGEWHDVDIEVVKQAISND